MLRKFISRLTYANVIASVALFVAIGGGAYAAGLAKNSVGSKQIKDGQVKSADVKDNSLTGTDIKEQTLSPGPQGPKGDQGDPGADGKDGASALPAAFHSFGLPGLDERICPPDDPGFYALDPQFRGDVGYYRDTSGLVVLQGTIIQCGVDQDLPDFGVPRLPPGFAPGRVARYAVPDARSVTINGDLILVARTQDAINGTGLDGITFRCAPSGQDGCP